MNLNNQKGSELPRVIALKIRITDLFNNEFIYKHMQIIQENCVMKIKYLVMSRLKKISLFNDCYIDTNIMTLLKRK